MRQRLVFALAVLTAPGLIAQAKYTASRRIDLQVGGSFVYDRSDYDPVAYLGFGAYATADFRPHLGAEIDFRQQDSRTDTPGSSTSNQAFQQTYEVGPRYVRTYGRVSPYLKGLYGRGRFRFPDNQYALLAYNMFAGGAGVDFQVKPWLNLRVDYEYQDWISFPPRGLNPQVLSFGVAYHFPGALRRGEHF